MRPYVSGPIAGLPNVSREEKLARFTRAELVLRQAGHEPVNPLGVEACVALNCNKDTRWPDGAYRHTWSCYLKHDLIAMLEHADSIAILPGWESSSGALLEKTVAQSLGWPVIDLSRNPIVLGLPYELEGGRR